MQTVLLPKLNRNLCSYYRLCPVHFCLQAKEFWSKAHTWLSNRNVVKSEQTWKPKGFFFFLKWCLCMLRDSVCRTVHGWIKLYTFGESLPLDFLNLSFSFLWEGRFQKSEATQTCPPWTSLIIRNCRGSFKSGFWDKHLLLLPAFPCSFGGLFCAWRSRNQTWGWLLCVWANQQWGVWLLSFADEWSNRETPQVWLTLQARNSRE